MTDQEIIQTIKEHASPRLWREVEQHHQMSIDEEWEQPYTIPESFDYISELADSEPSWGSLRTPCRKVSIALGEYVPMTQEQIDNTVTSRGTKWDFKLGGVAYQFSHHVASA